jgi:hypothetical protein
MCIQKEFEMSMSKLGVVLALSATAAGCVNLPMQTRVLQQTSAGFTGCAPENNVISNTSAGTWNASCNGKKFLCSYGANTQASCAPAAN